MMFTDWVSRQTLNSMMYFTNLISDSILFVGLLENDNNDDYILKPVGSSVLDFNQNMGFGL